MSALTIGEIATRAELNSSTLRYYESIGLIPPPQRVSGQRRYDAQVLERIQFIK